MIIPCCHQAFGHCYVTVCPPRHQLPQVLCRGKSGYKFSCSGCLHHKEVDDGFTIPMPYTMPVELNCFIIQWMPYKVEIILRCKIGRAPVYWYHHRVTEVFFSDLSAIYSLHVCFYLQVASLKVKINQVREELQKSMLNLDLEKAQLQKNELLELEAQLSQPSQTNPSTEEVVLP